MKIHLSGVDQTTACGTWSSAPTISAASEVIAASEFIERAHKHSLEPCKTCERIARALLAKAAR